MKSFCVVAFATAIADVAAMTYDYAERRYAVSAQRQRDAAQTTSPPSHTSLAEVSAGTASAPAQVTNGIETTKCGCFKYVDQKSGAAYYFNPTTGCVAWENPDATRKAGLYFPLVPSASEELKARLPRQCHDTESGRTYWLIQASGERFWEHHDPCTNKTYYENAATGETYWQIPRFKKKGIH
jgi:hypothetical protein